ncbi:hypothetical protein NL676_024758 [Syzygium grande]|nr:hypothetical protein NL676_024758 [Syzygium grande]
MEDAIGKEVGQQDTYPETHHPRPRPVRISKQHSAATAAAAILRPPTSTPLCSLPRLLNGEGSKAKPRSFLMKKSKPPPP